MKSDLLDSAISDRVLEWDSEPEKPLSLSKVIAVFAELSKFHRPSYKEAAVREWIIASAEEQNCLYRSDEAGNLVVYVPASPQVAATAKTLILQSHLDMVCVSDGDYDWSQGVQLKVEDGCLKACSTSLGADDGIGVAMMVQLLRAHQLVVHPPLELLFTVAEEVGLKGALALDPQLLQGNALLNIDSSDSESFTDGGAGSKSYVLRRKIKRYKNEEQGWRLLLEGLPGGHSGARIHNYENNAILLAYRCYLLLKKEFENDILKLSDLKGGEGDNIIPNHAQLDFTLTVTKKSQTELGKILEEKLALLLAEERLLYPKLTWKLQAAPCKTVLDKESAELLKMLPLLPNGAYLYNHPRQVAGLSANLAVLELAEEELFVKVSTRFARLRQVDLLEDNMLSVAELFGCQLSNEKFYPSWPSVNGSPLQEFVLGCYSKLFKEEADVYARHAGLESGVIVDRLLPRKVDALSFGPTRQGQHTVKESLSLKGCDKTLQFFEFFLKELADA